MALLQQSASLLMWCSATAPFEGVFGVFKAHFAAGNLAVSGTPLRGRVFARDVSQTHFLWVRMHLNVIYFSKNGWVNIGVDGLRVVKILKFIFFWPIKYRPGSQKNFLKFSTCVHCIYNHTPISTTPPETLYNASGSTETHADSHTRTNSPRPNQSLIFDSTTFDYIHCVTFITTKQTFI